MITIYKYPIPNTRNFTLDLPVGARILSVQPLEGEILICLWALVENTAPIETRWFTVFGTGFELAPDGKFDYITTIQLGRFVWHIFEVIFTPHGAREMHHG